MLDNILSFLIVIVAIEILYLLLFSINENDENVLIIVDDYDKPKTSQLRTLSFYESDEYEDISDKDIIEIPSLYSMDEIKDCYLLLDEYSECLNNKNENNDDCIKLLEEKLYEFEQCDLIYSSISSSSSPIEDKTYDFKYNIDDIFENIKDDFNNNLINNNNENEEEIEFEEMNNKKKEEMFQKIIKESFIMKNDKDCVEYELSEEDENVIKCAKYE